MTQLTPETYQVMSDYKDLWNGDFSKLDVLSESVTVHEPTAPEGKVQGPDACEAFVRKFRSAFPDAQITPEEMLEGEEIVMVEFTLTGTHKGEFNDIPPTDRGIELTAMSKITIVNGKVQEDRIYYDSQELFTNSVLQKSENDSPLIGKFAELSRCLC